jgi:hypothetical protein
VGGDAVSRWRLIITDSESLSGVAPVCPHQTDVTKHSTGDGYMTKVDEFGVYDCCPYPQIECWSPSNAEDVRVRLDRAEAEVCT